MNASQVCSCMLLCFLSASIVGCEKQRVVPPPPPNQVTITACKAEPDERRVHDNDVVPFLATDDNYQVTFLPTTTPSGPTVPVSPNPFVVQKGISIPKTIHGPSNCAGGQGCPYKYSLTRMQGTMPQPPPCADPTIRILP